MNSRKFSEALEDFGWKMLKAALEHQGHRIEKARWPDRERKGRQGTQSGVDVEFLEDGRPVGLEIMELFESPKYARQRALMNELAQQLKQDIGAQVRALNPNVVVAHWRLHWLPSMRDIEPALDGVKAAIIDAAGRLQPGGWADIVDARRPPWALELDISCYDFGRSEFGVQWSHVQQNFWMEGTADDMAEAIVASRKATQLAGYADARILGLDRAQMPLTGLLWQSLLKRAARIPANWKAIYFVEPGAAGIVQVWPHHDPLSLPPATAQENDPSS